MYGNGELSMLRWRKVLLFLFASNMESVFAGM